MNGVDEQHYCHEGELVHGRLGDQVIIFLGGTPGSTSPSPGGWWSGGRRPWRSKLRSTSYVPHHRRSGVSPVKKGSSEDKLWRDSCHTETQESARQGGPQPTGRIIIMMMMIVCSSRKM